ncbi:MAG: polymerase, sigma-24 subunit, subfamily [Labilithrix sp.]|nr:polymerase, sigma-24 subunit, subfamily [Labilithrix sp.]
MGEPASQRWKDDLDLATRCVGGDRSAQRTLYEREKRRVHATLYRIFGSNSSHPIDDAIQETFLQVFRSLRGFRGDSSLATWIDRCAVRAAYAHLTTKRDLRKGAVLELVADIPSGDPSAERRVLAREAARRLYAELEKIDPKQRIAFTLHALDGHSLADVATMMESTLVATKARVWRARQHIEARARKDEVLRAFVQHDDASHEASEEGQ